MSRKLFSLIVGLVLVFNFGIVQTSAQAEENGTISEVGGRMTNKLPLICC